MGGIERAGGLCALCNSNITQDEYHFITEYPRYEELRIKHIKLSYYYYRPNCYRFIQLLATHNTKELNNLGKYLVQTKKIRDRFLLLNS